MKRFNITKNDVKPKKYETHIFNSEGKLTRILAGSEAHREFVPFKRIPDDLIRLIINTEDKRFYNHHGIDTKGLMRSIVKTITTLGKKPQGGSTITQQLIKNTVFPDWYSRNKFKDKLKRKVREIVLALKLERIISKDKILENYLNVIYFGNGCYGVQTASKLYLGKNVWELSLAECALLAGLPLSPGRFNPITRTSSAVQRQRFILRKAYIDRAITRNEYSNAIKVDLYSTLIKQKRKAIRSPKCYSYFEDSLLSQVAGDLKNGLDITYDRAINKIYSGGLRIYSSEDSFLQRYCEKVFRDCDYIPEQRKRKGPQTAMILMDPDTGYVLASVGGRGTKKRSLIFNRSTDARRDYHHKSLERFFEITNHIPQNPNGISIIELCIAYSNYESREKTDAAYFYKKVLSYKGKVLLDPASEPHTKDRSENESLSYIFNAPLPPMMEFSYNNDIWVVGRAGSYVLGVWGGYDDNRILPLKEEYYSYPRKLWKEVAEYLNKKS